MCVIHEAEQVEVGEFYILVDSRRKTLARYGVIQMAGYGKCFKCWGDSVNVERAIQNGMRFYGPVHLQPAQESAAGGGE